MKTSKFKTRLLLKVLPAILLIGLSACLLTGCPQKAPKPVYYAVTLEDAGGKITANPALQEGKALKDSVIIFTASPADSVSHEVDKWAVTGGQVLEGGTDGSTSVKVKITADTKIKVTFKEKPKYTVTFTKPADGSLTASDSIASGASVYKGTVITFTAKSDTPVSHETDTWVVTGGTKISGGEPGDPIVRVKITADTKIKVTFKEKPKYTVTFTKPADGTLNASDSIASGASVYKGTVITFTAAPTNSSTHEVGTWEVTGGQILEGGTAGSTSVKVKITADTTVKVTFKIHFVQIPEASIAGVNPTYSLPGTEDWWKGVFIEGRTVHLSAYALSKTEVPYWLWKEVYDWAVTKGYTFANVGREGSHGTGGAAPTEAGKNEPVTYVSWRDCIVWCNAYTQKQNNSDSECVYRKSESDPTVLKNAKDEGACDSAYFDKSKKGYRLPTEAEWEYAARCQGTDETNAEKYGGVWLTKLWSGSGMKKPIGFSGLTGSHESWASLMDELSRVAVYDEWYNGSSWVDQSPSTTKTASVGSKEANALGLHDMSGNVREWCWDWYGAIGAVEETDPAGPASSGLRVVRGGNWCYSAGNCTVGVRYFSRPDNGNSGLGFRLAFRP